MRKMGYFIGAILAGYLLILSLVWLFQHKLIYYPSNHLFQDPSVAHLSFRNITFQSDDGLTLHGWYIPNGQPLATLLFFHGNAGNISGRIDILNRLHHAGFSIFIFDYRGYGQSEGSPSEEGTYKDAMAAWKFLTEEKNIDADRIILFGRSLGGAVAAWLATRVQPAGLVLESTFTSAADIGADAYPFLPVRQLIRFEYHTAERIQRIDLPVLIAHSPDDHLIPYDHGKKLFEMAHQPKYFLEMKGGHADGYVETGERYLQALQEFADKVVDDSTTISGGTP